MSITKSIPCSSATWKAISRSSKDRGRNPSWEYLKDDTWTFTEKVDGTNIRVYWDGKDVIFGGRTDSAQIPNGIINRLNELFYSTPGRQRLAEVFPDGGALLYGEGYGAKVQKGGGNYKDTQDFVLFDVLVGDLWLKREDIEDVARRLSVDIVPVIGQGTLHDGIEMVKQGLRSTWGDFEAEGLVARPVVELQTRRGQRIITKIKSRDFPKAA
ncbi:MAG: RNA ligase family protein [Acidimicrobiales bacterium]